MAIFSLILSTICLISSVVVAAQGHSGSSMYIAFVGMILFCLSIVEFIKVGSHRLVKGEEEKD